MYGHIPTTNEIFPFIAAYFFADKIYVLSVFKQRVFFEEITIWMSA
jgi:hypothetical protein